MKGHRVTARNIARCLLVLWFFALGASFAHACTWASQVSAYEHAEFELHSHAPSGDAGKATCLKFSNDAKVIANALQSGGGQLATAPPLSMPTLRVADAPHVAALASARVRWHTDRPELPIAIAYLRLML